MNELVRRALMGDKKSQEECTEKGIVLECPWCGCDERNMIGLSVYHEQYFYSCEACGCNCSIVFDNDTCDYPKHEALVKWNTRPEPPIGRCRECKNWDSIRCSNVNFLSGPFDYCSYFEPKESEEK